jgi:hypothetical protein
MSWIQELYKTYDQCEKYIGIDGNEDEKKSYNSFVADLPYNSDGSCRNNSE